MQDRPHPIELIRTVAETLRDKIMPQLSGAAAFEVRVAANALDLVARQLARDPGTDEAERARLQALLGRDGTLEELTRALSARLADGCLSLADAGVKDHLWATTLDKLAVDQPGYAAYAAETQA